MSIREELDPILEKWNLLEHPFYRDWREGRLSAQALRIYASEYADFIRFLPAGWEQIGDPATADEEREHADLWDDFADALGGSVSPASLAPTRSLRQMAAELFAHPASALGALYAFEAQQPATAASKLEGLMAHYELPERAQAYFRIHQNNGGEAAAILARIEDLPQAEKPVVPRACEAMAEALWQALSGIQTEVGAE